MTFTNWPQNSSSTVYNCVYIARSAITIVRWFSGSSCGMNLGEALQPFKTIPPPTRDVRAIHQFLEEKKHLKLVIVVVPDRGNAYSKFPGSLSDLWSRRHSCGVKCRIYLQAKLNKQRRFQSEYLPSASRQELCSDSLTLQPATYFWKSTRNWTELITCLWTIIWSMILKYHPHMHSGIT